MEYLDERFPHPPLMPVDPVSRARTRLMLFRIERDWYSLTNDILNKDEKTAAEARKELRDSLLAVGPVFEQQPYFLSNDFSLIDCAIAPLLWRLSLFGIELPAQAKPILTYAENLFARESFVQSLTETEREMRG
jgi:RNA polymerase-associated protein